MKVDGVVVMSVNANANALVFVKTELIKADCQLVVNAAAQVVTLLQHGAIRAQCHLSSYQFWLLVLLLKMPGGVLHAELLAMLDSSEQLVQAILAASNEQAVSALIRQPTRRWQVRLSTIAQRGPNAKRRELAAVRRSIGGKQGLNALLKEFGLVVRPVYKQGYILCKRPAG
jgi:chemotaxis response regulator CheB